MTPATHERLCLIAFAAWTLAGAVAGIWLHGWGGVLWAVPGFLAGAIVHKAVMESLPIRCPRCGGRAWVAHYHWPGIGTGIFDAPGDEVDTTAQSAAFYLCRGNCGFEQATRFWD